MRRLHHSWLFVVLGGVVLAVLAIRIFSFGVFLVPLATEFNWGRGAMSGANAVGAPVSAVAAILAGRLSDRYGPRLPVTIFGVVTAAGFILLSQVESLWQLYLTLGLLMPIGVACCLFPVMSTIPKWFAEKQAMAIGIAMTGFALGAVVWPPLAQWLITSGGWRQAFLVLGIITAVAAIPIAQFLRHSPERVGLRPYGRAAPDAGEADPAPVIQGLSLSEAARTRYFWLWAPILLSFFFVHSVILVHITAYALDQGVPAILAASTLSIIAAISIFGRLTIGPLSDRVGGVRKVVSGCFVLLTLALLFLLSGAGSWSFYVFAAVFGLAYGFFIVSETAVPAELFGVRSLGTIMATLALFPIIGGAVGQTLAGVIYDATGSYQIPFLVCIALAVLAVVLGLPLMRSALPPMRLALPVARPGGAPSGGG
ncbi:MAG: MFS transporter [Dehalococcoidales bacterium]